MVAIVLWMQQVRVPLRVLEFHLTADSLRGKEQMLIKDSFFFFQA